MHSTERFHYPFEFRGELGEFWHLWWRDVLFCLITLGVYMPWAEVNMRRYFYRHTYLAGEAFDYTAQPSAMLRGRAVVVGLLVVGLTSAYYQLVAVTVGAAVLLLGLLPWLLQQSWRHHLRHTVYCGVRGDCDIAYWPLLGWLIAGLVVVASAGLAYPYWSYWRYRLLFDASCYGTSYFEFDAKVGAFYRAAAHVVFAAIVIAAVMAGLYRLTPFFVDQPADFDHFDSAYFLLTLLLPLGMVVCAVARAKKDQLLARHLQLHTHRFHSTISAPELAWIYFSNTLLVMFTMGLLLPWAIFRVQVYRIERLRLYPDGDWEAFISAEQERAELIGDEFQASWKLPIAL